MYGTEGEREISSFKGDDHALTSNSLEAEQLIGGFVLRCAGSKPNSSDEVVMKKGGDLRRNESVA
jgi:hypothetical protein